MSDEAQTTREWRRLAEGDPFHAIAAWEGRERSWDVDEFYAVGRSDWQDFQERWRDYQPNLSGTCLEIGCGAGRITAALLGTFEEVVGLDVSPRMLELARDAAPEAKLIEVQSTHIPLAESSVDAAFTCHVLQHLETLNDVRAYVAETFRVLRPGGSAMIHVPIGGRHRTPLRQAWFELKLWRSRRVGGDLARYRVYPPETLRTMFEAIGFINVELREFRVRSNQGVHPFWLVRRPGT